jgi:chromate reductase, NAD(P)H dehydrogenase (quinone)
MLERGGHDPGATAGASAPCDERGPHVSLEPVHVLAFAGSLRRASFNGGTLRAAIEVAPADMSIETYDLAGIPLFNEDVRSAGAPEEVLRFKERIAQADALLIVTPEYNYSLPGVLKNAIDWASRPPDTSPLNGKPMAMLGAGGVAGSARAQQHLRQVASFTNMLALNKPEVAIQRAWEKFDPDTGDLIDERERQNILRLLDALVVWTRRLQAGEHAPADAAAARASSRPRSPGGSTPPPSPTG